MRLRIAVATGLVAFAWQANAYAWTVSSTSYSPCSAGQTMADGSRVRWGSVAVPEGALALGTRITLRPGLYGRHRFTVRDHIGHGSQLDIWQSSCSGAIQYGRRLQDVRVGWFHRVGRVQGHDRPHIPMKVRR